MTLQYASSHPPIVLTDFNVVSSGTFGSVRWTPSRQVLDILPVKGSSELLALKSRLSIEPHFEILANSLINSSRPAAPTSKPENLPILECTCQFGKYTWELSPRFEQISIERRPDIFDHAEHLVHEFFEVDVCQSLARFVGRTFPEYEHYRNWVRPRN